MEEKVNQTLIVQAGAQRAAWRALWQRLLSCEKTEGQAQQTQAADTNGSIHSNSRTRLGGERGNAHE